jgi:hypothetical protein
MSNVAEPLSFEKEASSRGPETGGRQAVTGSAESSFDPFVERLFGGSPAEPPDSAAGSLAVGRLKTPVLQRAQRLYGNRASQHMVMRARVLQRQCACGGTCAKCQEEDAQRAIQRSSASNAPAEFDGIPASQNGQALDAATRQPLEAHFGADLADVRVHTGPEAAQSAAKLDALAYTSGRDIYFSAGMYAPSSSGGQRLLAHEVAHVVQQSSGQEPTIATKSSGGMKIGAPDDPLEDEAERKAEEFMSGAQPGELNDEEQRKRREVSGSVQRLIQRQPAPANAAPATDTPADAADAGAPTTDPQDAGVAGASPDQPGGAAYSLQAACVARLGGCTTTRSAGVVEPADIAQYNQACRDREHTGYGGNDITPNEDECRQYTSGQLVDPAKALRLAALTAQYLARLSAGELTLADAETIDAALRSAYAALERGGAALPALPGPVAPPPEMDSDGPAFLLAGMPALRLAPLAEKAAGPALRLIQGGAAGGAVAGGEATGVATGTAAAAGGASVAATVGVVLLGVAVVVGIGVVIYLVVTLKDPPVDPTIPKQIDDANKTIEETLAKAKAPAQPVPLPEIGPLPNQRRDADQTCTNQVRDDLQAEINRDCKALPRGCADSDDCQTLRRNWFRNERCARSREQLNKECFGGGDPGHREAAEAARRAEENCRELYRRKC